MKPEFSDKNLFFNDDYVTDQFSARAGKLFDHQIKNWKLASDGYESLSTVEIKKIEFDNFSVEAHFNPGRIISSTAKVDDKSIKERPCFLCFENLPAEQKFVKIIDNYVLLLNPFPIFDKHFTIPSINHIPQAIAAEFGNLLEISLLMGKNHSVFYNGPRCGASAPDHLHFQAGNFGFMKIDTEFENVIKNYGDIIYNDDVMVVNAVNDGLRKFFSMESANKFKLESEFIKIYNILERSSLNEEPMLNIICNYSNSWRVLIYPRSKHRPSYFFLEGKDKILISPAAVDLGGVLILPREEDLKKITKDLIIDIFKQITITDEQYKFYIDKLKKR